MSVYSAEQLEPELSSWPTVIARLGNADLQRLRDSARRRLVETAEQYVARLPEISGTVRMYGTNTTLLTGDPLTTPLIMTGHQPVIFHSGLTFKYETTEDFAARNRMIAVAVVIDTDEGDAGAFVFPGSEASGQSAPHAPEDQNAATFLAAGVSSVTLPRLITVSASFGRAASLYGSGRLKSPAELQAVAARAAESLSAVGCRAEAGRLQHIAADYSRLRTDSMMEANLLIRRNAGIGERMLELPLSTICSFPEVVAVTEEILATPRKFAQCYNDTLNAFRTEHRIRNEANPFPNLQIDTDECELPFWIIDHTRGTRRVLKVRNDASDAMPQFTGSGMQLVPRGALITAILRVIFSDLFVHGTGGGRYDRYTDELIRAWWHVDPPPFAVASASRFLFESERNELRRLQDIGEQLRDLQFNPHRHFGTGVFSSALEFTLTSLVQQKDDAVERMKRARESGQAAGDIGREIQQLGDRIRDSVTADLEPQLRRSRELSAEHIATLNSRTWPWFLFESCKQPADNR